MADIDLWRVHVDESHDFMRGGTAVYCGEYFPGGTQNLYRWDGQTGLPGYPTQRTVLAGDPLEEASGPSLVLPRGLALPLALKLLGDAPPADRYLRQLHDAERARVDKLLDAITASPRYVEVPRP